MVAAFLRLAVAAHEVKNELGIGAHLTFVAIIAIDEHHQMTGVDGDLCALVVARRRPHPTHGITIDGQAFNIEHASADALIGFASSSDAKCQRIAHKLRGIKAADRIAKAYTGKVYQVDERVNLIEFLALQHAADELLRSRTVARRILTACLIDATCGSDARHLLQRLGGERRFVLLAQRMNFFPKALAVWGIHYVGLYAGTHKSRAHPLNLIRNYYFHCSSVAARRFKATASRSRFNVQCDCVAIQFSIFNYPFSISRITKMRDEHFHTNANQDDTTQQLWLKPTTDATAKPHAEPMT